VAAPATKDVISRSRYYTKFKGVHMVDRAGHWAHEEQPEQVSELLTRRAFPKFESYQAALSSLWVQV